MSSPRRRRSALLTTLTLLFAIEAVSTVAVRAAELNDARAAAAAPHALVAVAPVAMPPPAHDLRMPEVRIADAPDAAAVTSRRVPVVSQPRHVASHRHVAKPKRSTTQSRTHKPTSRPTSSRPKPAPTRRPGPVRLGANRVLSPRLGIDKHIYSFPCSRATKPGNVVYRWGCAGRNNVYLLGHAANVFSGLNRAYYDGRLKVGVKVWYADATGKVRTYAVRFWKVVRPTPDAAWAWASLSRPSMTLQTCLGAHSEYRLMVRLVQVG
jgi:hypothetical protein